MLDAAGRGRTTEAAPRRAGRGGVRASASLMHVRRMATRHAELRKWLVDVAPGVGGQLAEQLISEGFESVQELVESNITESDLRELGVKMQPRKVLLKALARAERQRSPDRKAASASRTTDAPALLSPLSTRPPASRTEGPRTKRPVPPCREDDGADAHQRRRLGEDECPVTRVAEPVDTGAAANATVPAAAAEAGNLSGTGAKLKPLRDWFEQAGVLAAGCWETAGETFVGDRIPAGGWPCKSVRVVDVDDDAAISVFSVWDRIEKEELMCQTEPIIVHSRMIQERYARSNDDVALGGTAASWTRRFVGKGRKLFVLFPPEDLRCLMLPQSDTSQPIRYVNPLSPPADSRDQCWQARGSFVDMRAGSGQLLILPAGWLHFVLTIEDSAMVCLDMSNAPDLARSLQNVQRQREIDGANTSVLEILGRYESRGFCVVSMLKRFVSWCSQSCFTPIGHCQRRRAKQEAKEVAGILRTQGLSDQQTIEPMYSWLQDFAKDTISEPSVSIPTLADVTCRDNEWEQDGSVEDLHCYLSSTNVSRREEIDDRGIVVSHDEGYTDLRAKAGEFLESASDNQHARVAFFEGCRHKQLTTAFDVSSCGAIHGATNLLFSEKGAVSKMHFDTGPYSAITFHLIANPCTGNATNLAAQPTVACDREPPMQVEFDLANKVVRYEFVVMVDHCELYEIDQDFEVSRMCELADAVDHALPLCTGVASKPDSNQIFVARHARDCNGADSGRSFSDGSELAGIVVLDEPTFERTAFHPIGVVAEGLCIVRDVLCVSGVKRVPGGVQRGVFEYSVEDPSELVLNRCFPVASNLDPWGVTFCSRRQGLFICCEEVKSDQSDGHFGMLAKRAAGRERSKRPKNKDETATGQILFAKWDTQRMPSWKNDFSRPESRNFCEAHLWRPGGIAVDAMTETLFVTSYSEEILALDMSAAQEHKAIIHKGKGGSPALPRPLDVAIIGTLDLMVTVGDSIHIYHRPSDASNEFIHTKTLSGEQERDKTLVVSGPNYIAVLELIELERNVEVHSLVWDEVRRTQAFTYISRSQDTFGWPSKSHPGLEIHFRLRIIHTGDARGYGVRYVGDETIPADTELMVYAGELLTANQGFERTRKQTGHRYIFDIETRSADCSHQQKCSKCKKNTEEGEDIVCNICDMAFHPKCVGLADHRVYPKWSCPDCTAYFVSQHDGDRAAEPGKNVYKHVDPKSKGNVARFINHSCEPNVAAKRNKNRELVYYSAKEVASGDWLAINYNPDATEGKPGCLCGAANCKGWYPL